MLWKEKSGQNAVCSRKKRGLEPGGSRRGSRTGTVYGMAVFCLLCLLCAGCGNSGENDYDDLFSSDGAVIQDNGPLDSPPAITSMPLLEYEDPDNENLAGLLQENGSAMMVRLVAGSLQGSGVLYQIEDDTLFILTVAHLFGDAPEAVEEVGITFWDGWETKSADFVLAEDADLAMVKLSLGSIPEEHLGVYLLANVNKEYSDALQAGDGCIAMGSRSGVAAEAYEGTILDPWIYMEDYGQYMIWARAEGMAGMSGGGLFDRDGHFLGILSGRNEDGELAVVPLSLVEGAFGEGKAGPTGGTG